MGNENERPPEPENWGTWIIQQVIHPLSVFLPPAILLVLIAYFVLAAFGEGFYPGIRSFAAVLFPLSVVTFAFIFARGWLARLVAFSPTTSFLLSSLVGLLVMAVIRFSARGSTVPISELVLSASFSLLVFSHASLQGSRVSAYSYGMLSGMMLYIIVLGFPGLR
ncbi:MAG: hypothetical protein QN131_02125 [Armatimonadota bacterium]|nr:hypothetical protein [Armatimonadota bacterium]MDR7548722.1 hypothetical protein [Armatimonadota bacterium]